MSDLSILWLNCNIDKFEHVEWVRGLFLPYADHVDHIGLVCHRPHSATYWPCWPSSTSPSSPLLPSPSACHSCQRIGRFMIWASNDDAFEWQFSWCLTLKVAKMRYLGLPWTIFHGVFVPHLFPDIYIYLGSHRWIMGQNPMKIFDQIFFRKKLLVWIPWHLVFYIQWVESKIDDED